MVPDPGNYAEHKDIFILIALIIDLPTLWFHKREILLSTFPSYRPYGHICLGKAIFKGRHDSVNISYYIETTAQCILSADVGVSLIFHNLKYSTLEFPLYCIFHKLPPSFESHNNSVSQNPQRATVINNFRTKISW